MQNNSTAKSVILALFHLYVMLNPIESSTVATKKTEIDPRIIGGEPISIQYAPWQVSVRLKAYEYQQYGQGHICGGSVISQRVVLTAAHCIANEAFSPIFYRSPSEYTLVMGTAYLYATTDYTLQYDVLAIAVHSNFNITTLANDVAMFFINGYIQWNWPTVQAIPLNTQPEVSGTLCTISGWGKTSINNDAVSGVLMGATIPIVDYATCDTNYGNITLEDICAGYMQTGGVDSCQGDSGGPLVCGGLLAGIVSWGYSCALAGYPGVYTNVSYYDNWIVTNNQSFNYSLYYNSGNGIYASVFISLILPMIMWVSKVHSI